MGTNFPITRSVLDWLEQIISERFGYKWSLTLCTACIKLELVGETGSVIFDVLEPVLTQSRSDQPFTWWDAEREGWKSVLGGSLPSPGVERMPYPLIEKRGNCTYVHYDIPGLIYWMLARIEEIGRTELDDHERFPATSSHAYKNRYLDRPVVDEWLHVLGQVIERQWLGVVLKRHEFKLSLSHDVDRPARYGFANPYNLIRRMVGDFARGEIRSVLHALTSSLKTKTTIDKLDPFNTFDWIMDQSEYLGLTSDFYFLCGKTSTAMDGEYDIEHPSIRYLLRRIYARGHRIGLHPSYNTFVDAGEINREANKLRQVCEGEGIKQFDWASRMHYLRWKQPKTLRGLETAGIAFDSTLTYADYAGFRCGTCFEYPMFDAFASEAVRVRERPLIAMEASIFNKKYMALDAENGLDLLRDYKNKCKKLGGIFTLLWHNSELTKGSYASKMYSRFITDDSCG